MSTINLSNIQLNIPSLPDGRVKDFLTDLTNPQSTSFKVFVVVVSVLSVVIISLGLYRIYNENKKKPRFFTSGKDATRQIIIDNNKVSSTESEFAYTTWLYINGLENRGSSSITGNVFTQFTNAIQSTISTSVSTNYSEQCPSENNNSNIAARRNDNTGNTTIAVTKNNAMGQWKHVFTKGVPRSVNSPEQCPGLWVHPKKNALRLCIKTKDKLEIIDIDNIPLKKWFHIAISVNNAVVEVYMDGLLLITKTLSSAPEVNKGNLVVNNIGGFQGALSQLQYFPNALNVSKVMRIYSSGPYGGNRLERIWNSLTFKTWRLKRQIKSLN